MTDSPAEQLSSFIDKFDPAMRKLIRECRAAMRKRFPTANELVYDNYNFFVIGYGPTERPSDCILSLAANTKGIILCFLHGATLLDPRKLLQGSGSQNRFIRLVEGANTLKDKEVRKLIDAAEAQSDPPFSQVGRGTLIIRSVSAKQRPRR